MQDNDRLEQSLKGLERMISSLEKGGKAVHGRLVVHDSVAEEVSGNIVGLKEKLAGMRECLGNIEGTKVVVDKVTAKFDDIAKAKKVLDRGANLDTQELLATCDTLKEAVRYARSLTKSQPNSRSHLRQGDQQGLLDTSYSLLQNQFRKIATSSLSAVDFASVADLANVKLMDHTKAATLEKIATRLTPTGDTGHFDDFATALKRAISQSTTSCTEPVLAALDEKRKKDFSTPGTHPCLDSLKFYKRIITVAMDLGRVVFSDDWVPFLESAHDLVRFVSMVDVQQMLRAVEENAAKWRAVERIYIYLDISRILGDGWPGVFPSHAPGLEWSREADGIAAQAESSIDQYLRELSHSSEPPSFDGTVYGPLLVATNLLARILNTYTEGHYNFVASRGGSGLRTFRDLFSQVIEGVESALRSKSEALVSRSGKPVLGILFSLNNYHYLHKQLLEMDAEWVADRYCSGLSVEVKSLKAKYLTTSWGKVVACVPSDPRDTSTLSSDTRDWIKKHFHAFNSHLSTRIKEEQTYSVPNPELRRGLLACVADYIVPQYATFHGKYSKLAFSSQPQKYIKYAPNESRLLDSTGQNVFEKLFSKH